ncbi:MAG: DegQ family serine endoprotease [Gammaproteobacteria bacterium]
MKRSFLSLVFSFAAVAFIVPAPALADLPDFTQLVEKQGSSVVNISTTRSAKPRENTQQLPMDPFADEYFSPFRDLFPEFFGDEGFTPRGHDTRSLGSGFLISADGFLLTNNHVIRDADEIQVSLNDGREYIATVIGEDEGSDLALLKIDEKDLPFVEFGSSTDLKVGEWVLAIGSPYGFEQSVTAGIVSAKGRPLYSEKYVPFIQTDVAINPGNSGGPLFNLKGQVVGINSQIISTSGGYIGLSFAVPSDVAVTVIDQLKTKGYVSRGWLGVVFQNVDSSLAESFGLERPEGALVAQVVEDSPASAAGLKSGDILTKYNDQVIKEAEDLPPLVGNTPPNSTVVLTLIRDAKEQQIKVKIAELEPETEEAVDSKPGKADVKNRLGIQVRTLTDEEISRLGVEHGVLVTALQEDGAAADAGIRRGDVIFSLNQQDIATEEDFNKVMASIADNQKAVPVLIGRRGEGKRYLAIKLK